MSDKPIDLQRRRKLLQRMTRLEEGMRELRREFSTPEQLQKLALAEIDSMQRHFKFMSDAFELSKVWLLELVVLWGVYLKLSGHDPDPSDALAMATKDSSYAKDAFKAAVLARCAKLEDELIQ